MSTAHRLGGWKAKKLGQRAEALALRALDNRTDATAQHVGAPVAQLANPGRDGSFRARWTGYGPPDLLVTLAVDGGPARHAWVEVKRREGTSIGLSVVKEHQLEALRQTMWWGNPACVLVCLVGAAPAVSGWWLVPVSVWDAEVLGRKSLTPELMTAHGARCYGAGRLLNDTWARPDNVPDWMRALRELDNDDERRCWVPVWGGAA